MVRQAVDPLRQERDLYFGGTRVAVVRLELLDEALLLLHGQSHAEVLPGVPPPIAASPGRHVAPRDGFVGQLEHLLVVTEATMPPHECKVWGAVAGSAAGQRSARLAARTRPAASTSTPARRPTAS